MDKRCEPLDQLWIAIPELIECPGLLLEHGEDRIRRLVAINHVGKGVITEICAGKFGVLGESDIKESCEVGGRGGRIRCRRHEFRA